MKTASILGQRKIESLQRLLAGVRDVPGAFAECGVYRGGNLRLLAQDGRRVYGFDTFAGLPQSAWSADEHHQPGEFADISWDAIERSIAGCDNVLLVAGYFPESAEQLADERFAFVHLDFDYYESTRAAIAWFLPRMSAGGAIVFDDYDWKHCPGVRKAIEEAGLAVQLTVPHQCVWWNHS